MKSRITTEVEKSQHDVNLLLNQKDPRTPREGNIIVDGPRCKLWESIFRPNPCKTNLLLSVDINSHDSLSIKDKKKLLQIDPEMISIHQRRTHYSVKFFPDEIEDCMVVETSADGQENSVFPINYTISLHRDGKLIESETFNMEVRIAPIAQYKPEVRFQPERKFANGIMYSGLLQDPVKIGYLAVKNSGTKYRTPALTLDLSISASIDDSEYSGLLFLGNVNEIEIVNPRPLLNPQIATGNIGAAGSCTRIQRIGNIIRIYQLPVQPGEGQAVLIPVYLQMSEIKMNPSEDTLIDIKTTTTFRRSYDPDSVRNTQVDYDVFELKRNTTIMDLEVYGGPEGVFRNPAYRLQNGQIVNLSAEYVADGATVGQRQPTLSFELDIANTAIVIEKGKENAGIYVKNLRWESPKPINGYTVRLQDEKKITPDLFNLMPPPSEMKLLNANNNPIMLAITYSDEFLAGLSHCDKEVFNTFVDIPFSFDYYCDKEGVEPTDDTQFSSFRATLRFRIFKRARPEWFCLDFGTSAVVASFARALDEEAERRLIHLQEMKEKLMSRVWPDRKESQSDAGEGSLYLMSSAAVLQDKLFNLKGNDYGNSPVLLSPPSIGYNNYYERLLPCLKSLVGNETIPNELIPPGTRHRDDQNHTVMVDSVLEMIYRQLFRFFIPDRVIDNAERMVLSFPNTFSPVHIKKIKKIATESLQSIRPDYLRSISESDAVAFYYNNHRNQFKQNSGDFIKKLGDNFDKNVLVYDMGAGTLDLTYFTRSKVRTGNNGNRIRISIDGKMGVSKAGNYLDYVLAEILVDLLKKNSDLKKDPDLCSKLEALLDLTASEQRKSLSDASQLKDYVKNHLKLQLDNPSNESLDGSLTLFGKAMPLSGITVGMVVSDSRFGQFLEDVTTHVFENFVALFGKGENGNLSLPVGLVIFSGRTTSIRALRRKVKQNLFVFGRQERDCVFADLSSKKFIDDIESPVEDIAALKTVVVDGALAYCRGKTGFELINTNVYATYGIFLIDSENGREWLPLIDHRTKYLPSKVSNSDDGIMIRQYDTQKFRAETDSPINPDEVDLSSYEKILLVQTYSKSPDRDWKNGRDDMSSIIGAIDVSEATGEHKIVMQINGDNQLIFKIDNLSQKLLPHDNYESESSAKAMWPVIRIRKPLKDINSQQIG